MKPFRLTYEFVEQMMNDPRFVILFDDERYIFAKAANLIVLYEDAIENDEIMTVIDIMEDWDEAVETVEFLNEDDDDF